MNILQYFKFSFLNLHDSIFYLSLFLYCSVQNCTEPLLPHPATMKSNYLHTDTYQNATTKRLWPQSNNCKVRSAGRSKNDGDKPKYRALSAPIQDVNWFNVFAKYEGPFPHGPLCSGAHKDESF